MDKNKTKNTLESIENYLFNSHKYGFWVDFESHTGSTCWTTSYVGRNLANNPNNLRKMLFIKDRIEFNQRFDGGWAYNHTVTSDADTTANCLLFLSKFSGTNEGIIDAGIDYLLKHQDKMGGFFVYSEKEFKQIYGDKEGKGWCSPTVEVTSLATKALIESKYNGNEIQKSLEFIASKQKDNGSWHPYWWSSKEYVIVESIEVLEKFPKYKENVKLAIIYLTDKRREFNWTNDFTQEYSPFYAALALRILLKDKHRLIKEHKIAERYQIDDKCISYLLDTEIEILLNTQNKDGSFGPEPLMRIPRYDIIDISEVEDWNINVPHGNSVYTDNNRFFTTATVYSTLLRFLES